MEIASSAAGLIQSGLIIPLVVTAMRGQTPPVSGEHGAQAGLPMPGGRGFTLPFSHPISTSSKQWHAGEKAQVGRRSDIL